MPGCSALGQRLGGQNFADLDEVEILRDYLRSIRPSFAGFGYLCSSPTLTQSHCLRG
jgi:hypothetical protein